MSQATPHKFHVRHVRSHVRIPADRADVDLRRSTSLDNAVGATLSKEVAPGTHGWGSRVGHTKCRTAVTARLAERHNGGI